MFCTIEASCWLRSSESFYKIVRRWLMFFVFCSVKLIGLWTIVWCWNRMFGWNPCCWEFCWNLGWNWECCVWLGCVGGDSGESNACLIGCCCPGRFVGGNGSLVTSSGVVGSCRTHLARFTCGCVLDVSHEELWYLYRRNWDGRE